MVPVITPIQPNPFSTKTAVVVIFRKQNQIASPKSIKCSCSLTRHTKRHETSKPPKYIGRQAADRQPRAQDGGHNALAHMRCRTICTTIDVVRLRAAWQAMRTPWLARIAKSTGETVLGIEGHHLGSAESAGMFLNMQRAEHGA